MAFLYAVTAVEELKAKLAEVSSRPYAAEIAALRSRAEFVDLVEQRVVTMTGSERRQFDALTKGKAQDKR